MVLNLTFINNRVTFRIPKGTILKLFTNSSSCCVSKPRLSTQTHQFT